MKIGIMENMRKVVAKENNLNSKVNTLIKTVDSLAISVAKGFNSVENRLDVLENNFIEVQQNYKNIRHDIISLADRFPSRFALDELSSRVYNLEKKRK